MCFLKVTYLRDSLNQKISMVKQGLKRQIRVPVEYINNSWTVFSTKTYKTQTQSSKNHNYNGLTCFLWHQLVRTMKN